ncbi:MAG: oligosaccharide flippase family protein [Candidatus Omnitrophica bacterium]|nr:oligosaccharide flippase family protein [Candidatus Omnitrophota bacterium]
MTRRRPGQRSISYKVIVNTIYNTFGRFWGIIVGIFLTPYIISRVGVDRFGVWAVVGVVTGYFGLLDMGVGASFVKYISEFYARKEYNKISHIVNTGFTIYFILAIVSFLLVFLLKNPILAFLNMPMYLRHEAGVVLVMGIALFGASNAMSPFLAIQGGLQRMDITNNIGIGLSIVNIAGTIFFLERGFGIIGLMMNNVIVFVILAVVNVTVARFLMPELRFRLFYIDRMIFRRILNFGYNMQIAKVSGMVASHTDKILITCFLSIGLVTFYQLGSSVIYYAASLAGILTSALMPAFSEIEARGERDRLVEAYMRSMKYISFVIAPIFIYLAISAEQVIFIWLGYGYERSVVIIQILAGAFLINTIAQVPLSVSMAIDKPRLVAVGSLITIMSNIILSALFIRIFGFTGAAWGTLVAVNAGTIYFMARLNAEMRIPAKNVIRIVMPFFLSCAVAATIIFALNSFIGKNLFHSGLGRVESMALFFVKGAIFLLCYLVSVFWMKPFNADELEVIKRKIPFMAPIIARIINRP